MLKLHLIKKPVTTEKSVTLTSEDKYTFEVTDDANKIEVAKAIEELFGVKPVKVAMTRLPKKVSGKGRNKRKALKKATVTVKKGTKLDPSKIK